MTLKEKIRNKIIANNIRESIQLFLEALPFEHEFRTDLQLKIGDLNAIEREYHNGAITNEVKDTKLTRLREGILNLLNKWQPGGDKSLLDEAIDNLKITVNEENLGVIQLVNCDRRRPFKRFRRVFNRKSEDKAKFQYYFLAGCPNQMPNSLAERIVYQIMEEEGVDLNNAVHYPFIEGDFRRMETVKLPLGSDENASKKKFKQYVQRRFKFVDTETFEAFIETGLPKLPYTYVIATFDIPEKEWRDDEGELEQYFQWMVDTFSLAHENVPTFIFFFNIKMREVHNEDGRNALQKRILRELEAFCEKNDTALLQNITPIEMADFEDWADDLGVNNPNDARSLVAALQPILSEEDRRYYEETGWLHMKDIEPLQAKIILKFREQAK
jgi:hypothetical protein